VNDFVTGYDSQSEAYRAAFAVFLAHTDQKTTAFAWLDRLVRALPARNTFIDVGAGNGALTARFLPAFGRTIAIEPSPSLGEELRRACPRAEVLPHFILDAHPEAEADFVLCSHVFYYVPAGQELDHLRRLVSWLAPGGVAVVALQNPRSDGMRMTTHFYPHPLPDLAELGAAFRKQDGGRHEVSVETVRAKVETADFADAFTIAHFMVSNFTLTRPLRRAELEGYVREYFAQPGGGFRFSCDQDFLTVRRPAAVSGPS
jgi:trans-aconitate methyltransferase